MSKLPQKKMTGADLVVLIFATALTLLSGARFFPRSGEQPEVFTVAANGTVAVYPLTKDAAFTVESEGVALVIAVDAAERAVAVVDSDCPDHVCQNTGRISRPGQTIVCVPAKTVIRIGEPDANAEGGAEDVDFIVG